MRCSKNKTAMVKERVLVIAPHMDDEVLGCGGIICRHSVHDKVWVIFVAHRVYNHIFDAEKNNIERKHALKARDMLGYHEAIFLDLNDERLDASVQDIIIPLERLVPKIKPSLVYVPFRGDNNQDHRAVFDAARVVLRPSAGSSIKAIRMYEVASSTEQSPPLLENAFLPNFYVDIEGVIEKKMEALSCYQTEKRSYPHPRSVESVKILAQRRGVEAGYRYAEAFMTLREKWSLR